LKNNCRNTCTELKLVLSLHHRNNKANKDMVVYNLIFQRGNNVSVETYKEFEYGLETYENVVKHWKTKTDECEFIRERSGREFGYFRVAEFTNGITITFEKSILREYKNKIK